MNSHSVPLGGPPQFGITSTWIRRELQSKSYSVTTHCCPDE